MHRSALFTAVASISIAAAAFAASDIREGLWEISVQTSVGGQPITAAPMVVRQCISQQSVQELMAQASGTGACRISDFQQSGNHANWQLACTGAMDVTGTGETDIAGDQFTGRMDLASGMGGETMPMQQRFEARRLGDCQ
jgi:Protein of unknown function (DUF3617)